MGGAINEEQVFAWELGQTGLTIAYRIVHWNGSSWDVEVEDTLDEWPEGLYDAKFTPDAAGFWLALGYYDDGTTGYHYGQTYFIGMGVAQDIYDIIKSGGVGDLTAILADTNEIQLALADGGFTDLLLDSIIALLSHETYGLSALDTDLETLITRLSAARAANLDQLDFNLQEAIGAIPTVMVGTDGSALAVNWTAALATALAAYTAARGANLDQLDFALQEAIAALQADLNNPSQYKADVSALALEATLGTHDTDIKAVITTVQADLDNPSQYKADVAGLAPASEYDTELDQTLSATELNIRGADSDTLETLSDQIDGVPTTTEAEGYVENAADVATTHDIQVADATTEQIIVEIAKTGIYDMAVTMDLDALEAVGEGGLVVFRVYEKTDLAPAYADKPIGYAEWTDGDKFYPSFIVSMAHQYTKITVQCGVAVTAQRDIVVRYKARDLGV